jgi:hypothetical protein
MEYLAPLISPPDGVSQHWPLLVQPHGQAALAEATTTLATNNESIRNIWKAKFLNPPEARSQFPANKTDLCYVGIYVGVESGQAKHLCIGGCPRRNRARPLGKIKISAYHRNARTQELYNSMKANNFQ